MIDDTYLYLVKFNNDCFIVKGCDLKDMKKVLYDEQIFILYDIAGNFYQSPFTEKDHISYQKLYDIKSIELR